MVLAACESGGCLDGCLPRRGGAVGCLDGCLDSDCLVVALVLDQTACPPSGPDLAASLRLRVGESERIRLDDGCLLGGGLDRLRTLGGLTERVLVGRDGLELRRGQTPSRLGSAVGEILTGQPHDGQGACVLGADPLETVLRTASVDAPTLRLPLVQGLDVHEFHCGTPFHVSAHAHCMDRLGERG